ncbi:MAG TPA: hypothetical protein DCZ69_15810, partial [Syntrophobacteraceae bacterium]|nr:hypothetical protein [Syntrophobacteraceae bacterium]
PRCWHAEIGRDENFFQVVEHIQIDLFLSQDQSVYPLRKVFPGLLHAIAEPLEKAVRFRPGGLLGHGNEVTLITIRIRFAP